jgi:hypothetical protein
VFYGCALLRKRARSYGAEIPSLFIAFGPMVRHGVATNAARAKSAKSCECVRGSWIQGTVSSTVQYHDFSEGGEQAEVC